MESKVDQLCVKEKAIKSERLEIPDELLQIISFENDFINLKSKENKL